jgi:hypothetical protein
MALADTGPAPYAPVGAIELVIEQHRERGLSFPITSAYLHRIGIEESLARRVFASLKQLDLLTEEGEATETLQKIKVAPSGELQNVLGDWVRAAYKPIFQYADLSDIERVTDQFRHYEPGGMRNRMVSLFLGLCVKAGLIEKTPAAQRAPRAAKSATAGTGKKRGKGSGPNAKVDQEPETKPPVPPAPPPASQARDRYVDFLIEKAKTADELDSDLLDRIERALGIGASQ